MMAASSIIRLEHVATRCRTEELEYVAGYLKEVRAGAMAQLVAQAAWIHFRRDLHPTSMEVHCVRGALTMSWAAEARGGHGRVGCAYGRFRDRSTRRTTANAMRRPRAAQGGICDGPAGGAIAGLALARAAFSSLVQGARVHRKMRAQASGMVNRSRSRLGSARGRSEIDV